MMLEGRQPAPLLLCAKELPYVTQAGHLCNMLTEKGDMEKDASIQRARFIQSSVETRELFQWAAPEEVIKATKVCSCSIYGFNIWDLGGDKAGQV